MLLYVIYNISYIYIIHIYIYIYMYVYRKIYIYIYVYTYIYIYIYIYIYMVIYMTKAEIYRSTVGGTWQLNYTKNNTLGSDRLDIQIIKQSIDIHKLHTQRHIETCKDLHCVRIINLIYVEGVKK